jgi:TPR repeat protein
LPEAELRVGPLYLEGSGVPRSQTEGMRWLERAASHGLVEAQSLLATLYMHGFGAA